MKTPLNTVPEVELVEWLKSVGQPQYRAKQILSWIHGKFAISADEMKNIPASLRAALDGEFELSCCHVLESSRAGDGTEKFLLGLHDGGCVECVIIPSRERTTF